MMSKQLSNSMHFDEELVADVERRLGRLVTAACVFAVLCASAAVWIHHNRILFS